MSIFIQISLDECHILPVIREQLVAVCPVKIFGMDGSSVHVIEENQDECTLCELCLQLVPRQSLTINKLYKKEALFARGVSPR